MPKTLPSDGHMTCQSLVPATPAPPLGVCGRLSTTVPLSPLHPPSPLPLHLPTDRDAQDPPIRWSHDLPIPCPSHTSPTLGCMWRIVHHCPTESPASTFTSAIASPN